MATLRDLRAADVAANSQRRLAQVAGRIAAGLEDRFILLDGLDARRLDDWLAFAVPLAQAGQQAAVDIAYAYAQLYATLADSPFDDSRLPAIEQVTGPALRKGATYPEVYSRAMITARTMIAHGHDFTDAMLTGAARAAATGRTDVANAARVAQHGSLRAIRGARGYVRVPGTNACRFCRLIATNQWSLDVMAPAHPNCTCTQAPVVRGLDPSVVSVPSALKGLGVDRAAAATELASLRMEETETGLSPWEVAT